MNADGRQGAWIDTAVWQHCASHVWLLYFHYKYIYMNIMYLSECVVLLNSKSVGLEEEGRGGGGKGVTSADLQI